MQRGESQFLSLQNENVYFCRLHPTTAAAVDDDDAEVAQARGQQSEKGAV